MSYEIVLGVRGRGHVSVVRWHLNQRIDENEDQGVDPRSRSSFATNRGRGLIS
jgi:hypothetical protein